MKQKVARITRQKILQKMVQRIAAMAGVNAVKIHVKKSGKVQAEHDFSIVIIHEGLLDCVDQGLISDQALQVVIAHEIGHIQHRDSVGLLLWNTVMLFPFRAALPLYQAARWHIHKSEYAADRTAATLMGAGVTIAALREMDEIRRQKEPRLQVDDAHPTTGERIAAIRRDFGLKDTSDSPEVD